MAAKTVRYELKIVKVGGVAEPEKSMEGVSRPEDVVKILKPIRSQQQEHFVTLSLDGGGHVINTRVNTVGLLNHSLVHPREVFRGAILDNAASIIIAHNHPSGSLEPSSQDIAITNQLKESGTLIGISVIDHIIVTPNGAYVSMRERGLV